MTLYKDLTIDDKWKFFHAKGFLLNFLGQHMVKGCISMRTCITCNRQHHSSIHQQQNPKSSRRFSSTQQLASDTPENSVNLQQRRLENSLLLFVPVKNRNKASILTHGFLDIGGNDSYLLHLTSDTPQFDESLEKEEFFMDGFHDSKQISKHDRLNWTFIRWVTSVGNF